MPTISFVAIASTMDPAFFTFAVMAVTIRSFDDTSCSSSSVMVVAMMSMAGFGAVEVDGGQHDERGKEGEGALHAELVGVDTDVVALAQDEVRDRNDYIVKL